MDPMTATAANTISSVGLDEAVELASSLSEGLEGYIHFVTGTPVRDLWELSPEALTEAFANAHAAA